MERTIDSLYDLYYELKEHVNYSCERRAEKTEVEKHIDKVENTIAQVILSVANTNERIDISNTVINARISAMMWRAISAFVLVFMVMAGAGNWLYVAIHNSSTVESIKLAAIQKTLHSIDKTVSSMNVRVNYNSTDLKEIKSRIRNTK